MPPTLPRPAVGDDIGSSTKYLLLLCLYGPLVRVKSFIGLEAARCPVNPERVRLLSKPSRSSIQNVIFLPLNVPKRHVGHTAPLSGGFNALRPDTCDMGPRPRYRTLSCDPMASMTMKTEKSLPGHEFSHSGVPDSFDDGPFVNSQLLLKFLPEFVL
jgi:hypothetical protein